MNLTTIKLLANAEYDIISIGAKLSDLAELLQACSHDSNRSAKAARAVLAMRKKLADVLDYMDEEITFAIECNTPMDLTGSAKTSDSACFSAFFGGFGRACKRRSVLTVAL
jgi:hypothetical protein